MQVFNKMQHRFCLLVLYVVDRLELWEYRPNKHTLHIHPEYLRDRITTTTYLALRD